MREYAQRKGRIHGTPLVDVETRRPIDPVLDREANELAAGVPSLHFSVRTSPRNTHSAHIARNTRNAHSARNAPA
ncbi:hypothetical protein ACH4ZX_04330 [Streptomyces sp. NPDC020490]|uniref:hypothetical protein n=1 Tax=Streptomyces sp. NPDC020490 TaxID=3365078 RepID=UPI0037BB2F95